jgi:hypothetical protein
MTASRAASRCGSFALNAPDESPQTDEEYQRRIEALEDSLHGDEAKLTFHSKELKAIQEYEKSVMAAQFDRLQEIQKAKEARMKQLGTQISQTKAELKVLLQRHPCSDEAKVTSVFRDTHRLVSTILTRHTSGSRHWKTLSSAMSLSSGFIARNLKRASHANAVLSLLRSADSRKSQGPKKHAWNSYTLRSPRRRPNSRPCGRIVLVFLNPR